MIYVSHILYLYIFHDLITKKKIFEIFSCADLYGHLLKENYFLFLHAIYVPWYMVFTLHIYVHLYTIKDIRCLNFCKDEAATIYIVSGILVYVVYLFDSYQLFKPLISIMYIRCI